MVANISFNPMLTTNGRGSFNIQTTGFIQGCALDDPAIRNRLAGGYLASTETLPMWGGVGISENVVPNAASGAIPRPELGGRIIRATNLSTVGAAASLTGFSVFDQNHSAINTPQSPVPLVGSLMTMNFYRLGSGARIPVKCDPSLVSLDGTIITTLVSWDFNNSVLQPYVASGATIAITSITWAANVGTVVAGAAVPYGLGDIIYISGATNTGTGGAAAVNGPFVINGFTDSTHFTLAMPAAAGVIGTIGGTILANVGTGALPVRVLDVEVGNSMTVSYDPVTGFATWDPAGTTAVILI